MVLHPGNVAARLLNNGMKGDMLRPYIKDGKAYVYLFTKVEILLRKKATKHFRQCPHSVERRVETVGHCYNSADERLLVYPDLEALDWFTIRQMVLVLLYWKAKPR